MKMTKNVTVGEWFRAQTEDVRLQVLDIAAECELGHCVEYRAIGQGSLCDYCRAVETDIFRGEAALVDSVAGVLFREHEEGVQAKYEASTENWVEVGDLTLAEAWRVIVASVEAMPDNEEDTAPTEAEITSDLLALANEWGLNLLPNDLALLPDNVRGEAQLAGSGGAK